MIILLLLLIFFCLLLAPLVGLALVGANLVGMLVIGLVFIVLCKEPSESYKDFDKKYSSGYYNTHNPYNNNKPYGQ